MYARACNVTEYSFVLNCRGEEIFDICIKSGGGVIMK